MAKLFPFVALVVLVGLFASQSSAEQKPRFPAFHCRDDIWCKTGDFCCVNDKERTCRPHREHRPVVPGCGPPFACDDTTCAADEYCGTEGCEKNAR
jgi:hypothetical protein